MNHSAGKPHFSLAILPERSQEVLDLFARSAHAHVVDTRVSWQYDPADGGVATTFEFVVEPREGGVKETLFALYPHQWRSAEADLTKYGYDSVRGPMKLARGTSFRTRMPFPGVLPSLPPSLTLDRAKLSAMLDEEAAAPNPPIADTYWDGKRLGKLATLVPIAQQAGHRRAEETFRRQLRERLEAWFTADDGPGVFYYNRPWGTLIGYPASYASDRELNDHHFHYGYFIRAAGELARSEPEWAAADRYGGMVRMLIRDIASPRRDDRHFPFLRSFDPYAGHSWASGSARFGDGNNQESSSEAMNAWYGLILWGEATGDRAVRDPGIWLYTTELAAIECYWFDVQRQHFPRGFEPPAVGIVWGGKADYATWFSAEPEAIHGINWLPIHGGSLYLGRHPEYVRRNYEWMLAKRGGTQWKMWSDLVWMFRGLDDPADALRQFEARPRDFRPEGGNSTANTYHWLSALSAFGQVDRTVTADYPFFAVFRKGPTRTYVIHNLGPERRTVKFADGATLEADAGQLRVATRAEH